MKSYRIDFSVEAKSQISALYWFIVGETSPTIAARYIEALLAACDKLSSFPFRGTARDDIRPGLRTVSYRRRATILFAIEDETVDIVGIFYGGQNWEARFSV